MNTEQLKKIFDENADCYFTQAMQSAMTSDKFIEVVSELMKPTDNEEMTSNELFKRLNSLPNYHAKDIRMKLKDGGLSIGEMSITTQPNPTWIEIKSEDDLPKDDGNVLVIIEGQMQIMCLCSIIDNDVYSKVWCMVYDGLDGDGIYDDNYYPTHWMPLPTNPQTTTTK